MPALVASQCCLFLDVDGTLIELTDEPEKAPVPQELIKLMQRSFSALNGALALVSGRTIAALDEMFTPLRLPIAGVHGIERRDARGRVRRMTANARLLDPARQLLREWIALHSGLRLEDKGAALALHFRRRPELTEECRRAAESAAAQAGPSFQVQEGSMVFEIKPAGVSKATAIEAYMREPPFAGRIPIAAGDDPSDSAGFATVRRLGGMSIAVGGRIEADCAIESCAKMHQWLSSLSMEGSR